MPLTQQLSKLLIHSLKSRLSLNLSLLRRKPSCVKLACTSAMTRADSAAHSVAMTIPQTRSLNLVARVRMRAGLAVDRVLLRRRKDDRWTTRKILLMLEGTAAVMMTMTSNWWKLSPDERVDGVHASWQLSACVPQRIHLGETFHLIDIYDIPCVFFMNA
jgi:hypothetical protein